MNNTIIAFAALGLAAACTPAPQVCERTVGMSKEGIPIMLGEPCVVAPVRVAQPIEWDHDDGNGPKKTRPYVSLPTLPEGPTSPPDGPENEPDDEPYTPTPPSDDDGPDDDYEGPSDDDEDKKDKPKGDNSDANGKGGNKHDRDDFTHGGTETAEEKKDD